MTLTLREKTSNLGRQKIDGLFGYYCSRGVNQYLGGMISWRKKIT